MALCDGSISAADSVSANVKNSTNTRSTNVTSPTPINSDDKNIIYKIHCDILHKFLLVIMLLLVIAIVYYDFTKQKHIGAPII